MCNPALLQDVAGAAFAPRRHDEPSPPADPDLARILRLAERVVPGLCGEQGAAPSHALFHDGTAVNDSGVLGSLCRHWETSFPEAGAHYLALRCWGLVIWQPIYLSVIAAHLDTHVPLLAGFAQLVENGFPRRFYLFPHVPVRGGLSERMRVAARELDVFCKAMRKELKSFVALHDRAADALQAECVLGALLQIQACTPSLRHAEIIESGNHWLAQLGITGGCSFLAYRARDGTSALALNRSVCCHYFRRRDGEKCSTCPKLPLEARIARLLADPS